MKILQETVTIPTTRTSLFEVTSSDEAATAPAAQDLVHTYCNVKTFHKETVETVIDTEGDIYAPILHLRPHIVNVASIVDTRGNTYQFYLNDNIVRQALFWPSDDKITITYTAGYTLDEMPDGIQQAARILTQRILAQDADNRVQDRTRDFDVAFYKPTYTYRMPMSMEVKQLLSPYRKIAF